MSANIEPLLTIADLDALPDDGNRYELFEGEVFVSRAPSLTHQRILVNITTLIDVYLASNPIGEILPTPGVIFDEYDGAIPDAVFITNEQVSRIGADERIHEAPALVIEIVSPGKENARRDRVIKRQVYGKHGVREYWVVDPEARSLEIYRLEEQRLSLVETVMDEEEMSTPVLPGFSCRVNRLFGR